uniref:Uncharacterized protein n=1 Tax=Anguilla anguilla TaxID=7936 RepID=A0A0E9X7M1_ANGAN
MSSKSIRTISFLDYKVCRTSVNEAVCISLPFFCFCFVFLFIFSPCVNFQGGFL